MKTLFIYALPILLYACKGKPVAGPPSADSTALLLKPGRPVLDEGRKAFYTEQGSLATKKFAVSLQSLFYAPDSVDIGFNDSSNYFKTNVLVLRLPSAKEADTLDLGPEFYRIYNVVFEDMTDSLKFKSLILKMTYPGSSDIPNSSFIEYRNGELRHLFSVDWLKSLQRKDAHTLSGIMWQRDEIVYGNMEIPFTVSLPDGIVKELIPDVQYIGNGSKALEPVQTYRVKNGDSLRVPYIIQTGTPITIDTFYRKKGIVRMMMADSIPVYIRIDDIGDKIEKNNAG